MLYICATEHLGVDPTLVSQACCQFSKLLLAVAAYRKRRCSPVIYGDILRIARIFSMVRQSEPSAPRKPRADAERNRIRLLSVAKVVFAEKGSNASLDEIARRAGVGAGTLYRHFPNRDALVAAIYRNETEQLVAAADRLVKEHAPVEALRSWLLLFVDYITTKHGMHELLQPVLSGMSDLQSASVTQMQQAISGLIERAVESGDVRRDLDPRDLMFALAGAAKFGAGSDGLQAARRLVDILIAGVRTPSKS